MKRNKFCAKVQQASCHSCAVHPDHVNRWSCGQMSVVLGVKEERYIDQACRILLYALLLKCMLKSSC